MFHSIYTINSCQENENDLYTRTSPDGLLLYSRNLHTHYALLNDPNEIGHVGAHKAERTTLWQHS